MNRRNFVKLALGTGVAALSPTSTLRAYGEGPGSAPQGRRGRIRAVVRDVLENIRKNGFHRDPAINDGLGGLWINWRTGTDPLQTNFTTAGTPYSTNKDGTTRHDELTDLRYLHNLWTCREVFPDTPALDEEIGRFTGIVKHELARGGNPRGWLYDLVIDLHRLSGDSAFLDAARSQAKYFADELFQDHVGSVCKIKKKNGALQSSYRVDHALEVGCALVQAGTVFDEAGWTAKGKKVIDFLDQHAYIPEHKTFPSELDEVVLRDGTANPDARFYRDGDTEGGSAKPPALGQMALSLLHAHIVSGDASYLRRAEDILLPLSARDNSLGLWDAEHGGYFDKAVFGGTHVRRPGTIKVSKGHKEGSRQIHLLQAFGVANRLTNGRYRDMEDAMLRVALEKAYYPELHGYVYANAPNWSLFPAKAGGRRDWVTTEAMGIALEALLSLERKDIW